MKIIQYLCDSADKADKAEALCLEEGCKAKDITRKKYSSLIIFKIGDGDDPVIETVADEEDIILVTGTKG